MPGYRKLSLMNVKRENNTLGKARTTIIYNNTYWMAHGFSENLSERAMVFLEECRIDNVFPYA